MVNVPIAATRRPRRPLLVCAVSVFAIAGALTFAGRTSSSSNAKPVAATWWDPGPLTSWAYVIGENSPIAVPTNVGNVQVYDIDAGIQVASAPTACRSQTRASSLRWRPSTPAAPTHLLRGCGYGRKLALRLWRVRPVRAGGADPGWPGEEFINVADWSTPVLPRTKR